MARKVCEDKSRNDMVSSSTGFCYTDILSNNPTIHQSHFTNQIQGYESNPEMFNLSTGMEMIGFSKNLQQQQNSQDSNSSGTAMWKGLFAKASPLNNPNGPSSSKAINESNNDFYQQHEFNKADVTTGISETSSENLLLGPHDDQSGPNWQENRFLVDDSNLRCVFPCEGNERPSQGLSLSLSSNNPSSIGLQSFELRHSSHHQDTQFVNSSNSRDGYFGKSSNIQQQIMQDGFLGKAVNFHNQGQFQLRSSVYLGPAQELLNEFCSLGTKQSDVLPKPNKSHKPNKWEDDNGASSSRKQPLSSIEFMELQKRKTKLLSMLEEVERRYKHYCDQMRGVVSSFEEVAGNGAARVYSALASKAMSRHFRCLKDGILSQIEATRKAMGEKDSGAPGTSRGETPRLRVLDQTLRQQRAFQQMNMLDTHPWRPQRGLPERSVSLLRAWLFEHFLHPYPSDVDKHILARQTGLSRSQVSNWFINARVRLWKPMVEEMYLEEAKEEGDNNNNPNSNMPDEEKPTPDQLVRIDSECLSSIITNPDKNIDHTKSNKTFQNHHHMHSQQNYGRVEETFGTMDLDFSSYNQHPEVGGVSFVNHHHHRHNGNNNQNFNGGGVSLTLGLQQHGANGGVSIAFSPPSQNSLFYPRDLHPHNIDECQPVQYSLLDHGDQGQNLPYRNLMGAQLLHDLAG